MGPAASAAAKLLPLAGTSEGRASSLLTSSSSGSRALSNRLGGCADAAAPPASGERRATDVKPAAVAGEGLNAPAKLGVYSEENHMHRGGEFSIGQILYTCSVDEYSVLVYRTHTVKLKRLKAQCNCKALNMYSH